MMEENNDIFLSGGDALVYLAEPTSVSTSVSYDPPPHPLVLYATYTFWMNRSISPVAYVLNG